MKPTERQALVEAANRAPSVHNIQPARFRFDDERTITLLEDTRRRLFVGDPESKDNQKSLGAAFEGLMLALSERGLGGEIGTLAGAGEMRETARVQVDTGGEVDPLAPFAAKRASYRGMFAKRDDRDRAALATLAAQSDLHLIEAPDAIAHVARMFDAASMEVLRAPAYRAELLSWMRLSSRHPNYNRDGLNAAHMGLAPVGMAEPLIAERGKVKSARAIALFHRPAHEPEFETGRRFYRVWLEIERAGFALCPMSVLADVAHVAERLLHENGIGADRKLVTVFRIGRRPTNFKQPPRVRLPASELIV